jgi:hypothetical protein
MLQSANSGRRSKRCLKFNQNGSMEKMVTLPIQMGSGPKALYLRKLWVEMTLSHGETLLIYLIGMGLRPRIM